MEDLLGFFVEREPRFWIARRIFAPILSSTCVQGKALSATMAKGGASQKGGHQFPERRASSAAFSLFSFRMRAAIAGHVDSVLQA